MPGSLEREGPDRKAAPDAPDGCDASGELARFWASPLCDADSPGEGNEELELVGEVRTSRDPLKLAFIPMELALACGCTG